MRLPVPERDWARQSLLRCSLLLLGFASSHSLPGGQLCLPLSLLFLVHYPTPRLQTSCNGFFPSFLVPHPPRTFIVF